jgi:hypothetical protein
MQVEAVNCEGIGRKKHFMYGPSHHSVIWRFLTFDTLILPIGFGLRFSRSYSVLSNRLMASLVVAAHFFRRSVLEVRPASRLDGGVLAVVRRAGDARLDVLKLPAGCLDRLIETEVLGEFTQAVIDRLAALIEHRSGRPRPAASLPLRQPKARSLASLRKLRH